MTTVHFTDKEYVECRKALYDLVDSLRRPTGPASLRQCVLETAGDSLHDDVFVFLKNAYADATVSIPHAHQVWAVVLTPEQCLRLSYWLTIYADSVSQLVVDDSDAGTLAIRADYCRQAGEFLKSRALFDLTADC